MNKIEDKSELLGTFIPSYIVNKIFRNLSDGIVLTDREKRIIAVNPSFEVVTGYKEEEVLGYTPKILQSGIHDADFYKAMWKKIDLEDRWDGEIWNRRKTGEVYPEWITIFAIRDELGNITNYGAVFNDLSEKKSIEDELQKHKMLDHLTEVGNRKSFYERMQVLLETSEKHNMHAVFFLNLNRFKQLNDTLGHEMGDIVLVEVAHRIKSLLKNKDILARYGGDEFIFTITNIHSAKEAAKVAEQVINKIKEPMLINNQEYIVSSSIGISLFPEDGITVEQLILRADKAMEYSKENSKSGYSFFFDDLKTDSKRALIIDQELRKAIDQKEFELYFQPKVDLKNMRIISVEALVRWNSEKLGFVSPNEFIPYAEETSLIIPLSEIILEKACKAYNEIAEAGYPHIFIGVNVSSIHFGQQSFLDSLKAILEQNNTSANHFVIEMTERTVMNDSSETISKLVRLKQLGFKLAIDDFGTGYSSLSYLIRFPLDILKIDRTFIQHITSLDEKQTIVDAIIQMSHRLKMNVVAEGVESQQQAELLTKMGCDYAQGFYYSKPISLDELLELLPYWEEVHEEKS